MNSVASIDGIIIKPNDFGFGYQNSPYLILFFCRFNFWRLHFCCSQLSAAQPAFHYDVTQWLSSLKLDKLAPIFEKFGLRSLEQVSNLKEADLVAIPELTSKQRKKILNSISSFNTPRAGTLFGGMQQTPVNNLYLTDKMYDFREHGV